MYALVDIETTGGHASAHGITEIAILLHNGKEVIQRYETLINPGRLIPFHIQTLTGITNEMVSNVSYFEEVAGEIYELLQGHIFVAHHVNFDYSFLKHHLSLAGYQLNCVKLCTVRLARKVFPGFPSYSLGKLCKQLEIEIYNRHRAGGDVAATAHLFNLILANDQEDYIQQALKKGSKEQILPPHLERKEIDKLSEGPGIYYFNNQQGKTIYVGKAKNIQKRVISHFSGTNAGGKRQEFLKHIYQVNYLECGTELMSFIWEAIEIKRLWPAYNFSLKRFDQLFGLYLFEDQTGYLRLAIDKRRKHTEPIYTFNQLLEAHNALVSLMKKFKLCPKLCFIQKNKENCIGITEEYCNGACLNKESVSRYNKKVKKALDHLKTESLSFVLTDVGRHNNEQSCILIEGGNFYGMGYLPLNENIDNLSLIKEKIQPQHATDYIRNLVLNYAAAYPQKITYIKA